MKAIARDKPKKFEPFTIELTFESEEEAVALYALMNHWDVLNAIPSFVPAGRAIKDAVQAGYGGILPYQVAHQSICDRITTRKA